MHKKAGMDRRRQTKKQAGAIAGKQMHYKSGETTKRQVYRKASRDINR